MAQRGLLHSGAELWYTQPGCISSERARALPGTHRDSKRKKVAVAVEAGLQAMHGFSLLQRGRQRHPKLWPAPVLAHPQAASGGIYRHGRPKRHKCRHLDHGAVTVRLNRAKEL